MSEFGAEEVDLDVLDSRVYVGNLPWAIRDDELREAFEPVGTVTDAKVILDRVTGRSKGFGFVTFATAEEANRAISTMHNKELKGRELRVNHAQPPGGGRRRRPYEGGGGGRGRRFGGPPMGVEPPVYAGYPMYSPFGAPGMMPYMGYGGGGVPAPVMQRGYPGAIPGAIPTGMPPGAMPGGYPFGAPPGGGMGGGGLPGSVAPPSSSYPAGYEGYYYAASPPSAGGGMDAMSALYASAGYDPATLGGMDPRMMVAAPMGPGPGMPSPGVAGGGVVAVPEEDGGIPTTAPGQA